MPLHLEGAPAGECMGFYFTDELACASNMAPVRSSGLRSEEGALAFSGEFLTFHLIGHYCRLSPDRRYRIVAASFAVAIEDQKVSSDRLA